MDYREAQPYSNRRVYSQGGGYAGVKEEWRDWLSDLLGVAAVLVLLVFLFGCGGGSSGTGLQGPVLEGLIVSPEGEGVEGVTVTVSETGDQTVSDQNGEFSVDVTEPVDGITVQLDGGQIQTGISVNNIPDSTTGIDIAVTVDPNTGGVSDTDVSLRDVSSPARE